MVAWPWQRPARAPLSVADDAVDDVLRRQQSWGLELFKFPQPAVSDGAAVNVRRAQRQASAFPASRRLISSTAAVLSRGAPIAAEARRAQYTGGQALGSPQTLTSSVAQTGPARPLPASRAAPR